MRKLLATVLLALVLGTAAPAAATIQPEGVPQPGCHLQGKAEFAQYWAALLTVDRALRYEACDPDPAPWGPR